MFIWPVGIEAVKGGNLANNWIHPQMLKIIISFHMLPTPPRHATWNGYKLKISWGFASEWARDTCSIYFMRYRQQMYVHTCRIKIDSCEFKKMWFFWLGSIFLAIIWRDFILWKDPAKNLNPSLAPSVFDWKIFVLLAML